MSKWQNQIVRVIDPSGLVSCPVGALVGDPHAYESGRGVVVTWDIAGDFRHVVEVCRACAEDSVSPEMCSKCGNGLAVARGVCFACFGSSPEGVWVS